MGGGVMRTAASRLVGIGAAVGAIRGSQSVPKPEYQTPFAAARRVPSISSVEGRPVVLEKTSSSLDDWELTGVEDDSCSLPRVVFGGAPCFDEAKEATLELKAAVQKMSTCENSGQPGSVTCHSSEVASSHAMQAFRFLSETPAAQNVVASIASDPNVWNAVLQNTAFVDYLESHRADVTRSPNVDVHLNNHISIEELQDLNCYVDSEASSVGSSESNGSGSGIAEIFQSIKLTVMDMMNHVSSFFQDVFGAPNADEEPKNDASSSTSSFIESATLKASIMGLAIMVISMVVLKRA